MFRLIKSSLLVLFSVSLLSFHAPLLAQDTSKPAFISDALYVFLHSGPSNQYRIIGSLNAGQPITFLREDTTTGYVEVQSENRTGWVQKEFVKYTPGLAFQMAELKKQYADHDNIVRSLEAEKTTLMQERDNAVAERDDMQEKLNQANKAYELLKAQVDTATTPIWEKPMMLGAMIMFAGLLFGLLLPLLMPKRKNSERWM